MYLSDGGEKISSDTTGDRSQDLPTSSLKHYATPGPDFINTVLNFRGVTKVNRDYAI